MNRRQRRALAKRLPGYKKILQEAKDMTFEEFRKMLEKQWAETTDSERITPADAAFLSNDSIEEEKKTSENETKNADGEENEAN